MKLVNVLVSTYNGEKYIRQQLESILAQSYSPINIYVRDDGSVDRTPEILQEYARNHQIELLAGENIGYGPSFLQLLQYADQGDFWAFCDQDDVWFPDKIQRAVEALEKMNPDRPNLYFHNFLLTDEQLHGTGVYRSRIPGYSFQMAITECLHMGFATVMNSKFRQLMLKGDAARLATHDWWAELIAMEFGDVYIDDEIRAKHRRLDSSVSSSALGSRIRWFAGAWKGNSEIRSVTREFQRVFAGEMNPADRKILSWFVSEKYSLSKALKKSFYRKRWRSGFASEIAVRCLMLFGKL